MTKSQKDFWGHLEVFRWLIIRCVVVIVAVAVLTFLYKDFVFDKIILAPCYRSFSTYNVMFELSNYLSIDSLSPDIHDIKIININLASQLFIHLSISFCIGLILAFPYLITELWIFVYPALYKKEIGSALKGIIYFSVLFFIGLLIGYFVIFPLTLNFLGSYQVSDAVKNQITLDSYISTFLTLIFVMGLVFEMPVVAYLFAKIGLLTSKFLSKYRKFAIVLIMIAAALITPSSDVFTMMLVAFPLFLLYELSRAVVKRVERKMQVEKE